jgi:GNAT superfamily N-acetyltransferase
VYPKVVLMAGWVGRARAALPPAREIALRDGMPILVRPILPEDKDRLREGLTRLSRASRYRRFLTALDPTQPAQPGLGVARYVRLPEDPTTAEAAVTVLDQYQGRGIGTILLEVLAASARQHGIRRFRAYVLAENVTMVEILRDLGAMVVRDGSLLRVDVSIPTSPEELPDTPTGRVFKAVAKQAMPPFRLRYPGTPDQEASTPSA